MNPPDLIAEIIKSAAGGVEESTRIERLGTRWNDLLDLCITDYLHRDQREAGGEQVADLKREIEDIERRLAMRPERLR